MRLPDDITSAAQRVLTEFERRSLTLATAESCTGGLVAAAITSLAGSSAVLERGFVTYSNQAKSEMLGVPATLIASDGAVSAAVARAMAEGALIQSCADIAVAITGIAGPSGGSDSKPVGLVHFAVARRRGNTVHHQAIFSGDRDSVRHQAVLTALDLALTPPPISP
jgi:nicotinamide-nucleotide amidase